MAIFTVGPNSTYPSIAAAMAVGGPSPAWADQGGRHGAGPGDTIMLEAGYSNETAVVTHSGMIISGGADSLGIVLQLGTGIATVTLGGTAPINVIDASDGNNIVGNDGDNIITVTAGADAASGGLGNDRLFVDYRLATGAVTGDSTSNVAEAGGGGRLVTINGGFEHFTIWTGSGADTITTGAGDDDIRTGDGAGTITAGEGANYIVAGDNEDTITAGSGGNFVDGGDGANTITTGGGIDEILTGRDMDTIVAGAGNDRITVLGGSDTVDAGADSDLMIVDYSTAVTDVTGGVTGGNLATGYTGHLADLASATLDFVGAERFWITTGSGNDTITTGAADDRLDGGSGEDDLDGGDGNDDVNGQAGVDTMDGGGGNDFIFVDNSGDVVVEADLAGYDNVIASVDYTLTAGAHVEVMSTANHTGTSFISLVGNELDNIVIGNDGENWLDGGSGGTDRLAGRAGDDFLFVDTGDIIDEADGGGYDNVLARSDYALNFGQRVEVLSTTNHGGTDSIDLTGNDYDNIVIGNAGDNVLDGSFGHDRLAGLGGSDSYAFTTNLSSFNWDTVDGFTSGDDHFLLDDAVFTGMTAGPLAPGAFTTGTAATTADHRIIYDANSGALYFDQDGVGGIEQIQFALVETAPLVVATDFTVI